MRKIYILYFVLFAINTNAQDKYLTKTGTIDFFSSAPIEDIKAKNTNVLSIINTENGEMAISMKIQNFEFRKELMQEHFNENYLESEKFPKSTFKGKILNYTELEDTVTTAMQVKGTMVIHGVSKEIEIPIAITKTKDTILVEGSFIVKLVDYKIKIPRLLIKNIAEEIKVSFSLNHTPYNN